MLKLGVKGGAKDVREERKTWCLALLCVCLCISVMVFVLIEKNSLV